MSETRGGTNENRRVAISSILAHLQHRLNVILSNDDRFLFSGIRAKQKYDWKHFFLER